jgi:hypothetical protein
MAAYLHGFDWVAYAGHVMPAFARWLIEEEESAVYQLFAQTRCAREERFLPAAMQRLSTWSRAREFIKTLPRGPQSRREYAKLCSAEHFTALSDRYLYKQPPQLYQNSDTLRSIWGAIVEEYCLPWCVLPEDVPYVQRFQEMTQSRTAGTIETVEAAQSEHIAAGELVSLLQAAGLSELAREVSEQVEQGAWQMEGKSFLDAVDEEWQAHLDTIEVLDEFDSPEKEESLDEKPSGVLIGHHPNTLHLRGWLAGISLRAMVLFEYLGCGRRSMPFGYEAGVPFSAYIGYLVPDEVWQLATYLRGVVPPTQAEAEEDYLSFRHRRTDTSGAFRPVDEVLPTHATQFLQAVHNAALQGLGLICSVE